MNETATTKASAVIIDLGQKSRKKIKRLRRGEGVLFDSVADTIAELQAEGKLGVGAQPVIVVVEKKRPNFGPFKL